MNVSIALWIIGAIAVVLGLFASRISPALAQKKRWLIIAGVALLVLGCALEPNMVAGFLGGVRGE